MSEFESARLATADDIETLVAIADAQSVAIEDERGGDLLLRHEAGLGPLADRLQAAIDDEDGLLVTGTFDGAVFGYAMTRITELADGSKLGVMGHFVVQEDAREVAVGEAIMNFSVEYLKAHGCFGVDSRALPGDRETKNFFESFGQKARQLIVHRSFEND